MTFKLMPTVTVLCVCVCGGKNIKNCNPESQRVGRVRSPRQFLPPALRLQTELWKDEKGPRKCQECTPFGRANLTGVTTNTAPACISVYLQKPRNDGHKTPKPPKTTSLWWVHLGATKAKGPMALCNPRNCSDSAGAPAFVDTKPFVASCDPTIQRST